MEIANILFLISHKLIPFLCAITGIGFIIAFHELGHFTFCKLFNIKTPSFSIGFGPRLVTKKIGETEFAISAIPLGGYVEIAGSAEVGQGEQADAYSTDERSFAKKPWIQKFLVMIGGIAFNIIFAYAVFSLLYMTGMPKTMMLYPNNATTTVQTVVPGSPAEQAGIQPGDTILAINNKSLEQPFGPDLVNQITEHPNQALSLLIARAGTTEEIQLMTTSNTFLGKVRGSAGIIFAIADMPTYPFLDSIKMGIQLTHNHICNTVNAFRHIFAKKDTTMVAGPIRIIADTVTGAQEGIKTLLLFLAIISISLAVLNLLPLPILDGGQILFYTIEAIIGRPLPEKVREYIHIACWIFFLLLTIYLSFKDIGRIAHPYLERLFDFLGWGKQ